MKLFAENGFEATSMDELAELTGLNKGTIYYYYKSKADILFDICYSAAVEAIRTSTPPETADAASAVCHIIDAWAQQFIRNKDMLRVYFQEENFFPGIFNETQLSQLNKVAREFMKVHYQTVERGIASGELRATEVRSATRILVSVLVGFSRWTGNRREFDKVVAAAKEFVVAALVAGQEDARPNPARRPTPRARSTGR